MPKFVTLHCEVCEGETHAVIFGQRGVALCPSCWRAEDDICGDLVHKLIELEKFKLREDAVIVRSMLRKFFGPKGKKGKKDGK